MKVSISWLKELVNLRVPLEEVIHLLPLRTIGVKEETPEYFELDMKGYNRADLLSLRGTAYEIAAITNSEVTFTENTSYVWEKADLEKVETEVLDSNLAPVYCLAKIEGLKVDKSPETWAKRLDNSGMRTVNNIADVTNLIMLEYGQPLHSFDADTVKDGKIIVRTAKEGEEIVTLDNKKRKLETTDLLITDPEKALGIAGVMGGKNSEVADTTTTILLEAAIFDPINLRNTAARLNLRSEASKRFQHGLTKQRCLQALDAAIRMYESLGGKVTAITLTGDLKDQERKANLTKKRLDTTMGIEIKPEDVQAYLERLNFDVKQIGQDWETTVPYFRLDIEIEDDLIEEVARMYGYEKIPPQELQGKLPEKIDQSFYELVYNLRTKLANPGLTEIQTYSYYSTQVLANFGFHKDKLIKLLNPMSAETEYLRDSLWPNLLEATAKNIRNGIKDVAIFEVGKVYVPREGAMPKESYHLAIALSNGTDNPIQELNQIAQILQRFHLGQGGTLTNKEYFHPTRHINEMAEVHPRIVNKFGINQRVAVLEIGL